MLFCVHPFQTLHLLSTGNNPLMELVLLNQHALSFMNSMSGSLSINTHCRMTSFCISPLRCFLTFLVNLPSMIFQVCPHPRIPSLLITRRTCWMLVYHSTIERIRYSLKIHLILHLSFSETQRMSFFTFQLPLYLIHLIMRMLMKSLIFLIVAVVIHLLLFFYHHHESITIIF